MGTTISTKLFQQFSSKPLKIFIGGLDASGKTSILYRLKLNQKIPSIPTIGFNVQQIKLQNNNIKIQCWDVGGGWKIRQLFHYYYPQTKALIWIVDCTDCQRLKLSAQQFIKAINDANLKNKPVLILANKQDLKSDAIKFVTTDEIIQQFNLIKLAENKTTWKIVKCSVQTKQGLDEAMNWLSNVLVYYQKVNKNKNQFLT